MRAFDCNDFDARVAIAELFASLLDPGPAHDGFVASIDGYARSNAYTFLIAFPDDESDQALSNACAVAIFSVYELPMAERAVLGVDALAIRPPGIEDAIDFLRPLARIAAGADLYAVCLAPSGVAKPGLVRGLAERGRLDAEPIQVAERPIMMRRASAGLWSPFADGPIPDRAFDAVPCLCIVTEDLTVDASGAAYTASAALYRGEGRLSCDDWQCTTLDEVAAELGRVGFTPRSPEPFGGTVPEQILHQGYVPQGTVSLSASFDVCAYYATFRGRRPSGIVFTIDADRLRAHGPIWDAYTTLVHHCDWFFGGEFETLTAVVRALGVRDAGRFLARCHAGTRARVEHMVPFDPDPIDWGSYVDGGLARLRDAGLEEEALNGLHSALEHYWMRALGQVAAEDRIHIGEGGDEPAVEARRLGQLAYEHAFRAVEPRLQTEALVSVDPGWDLTPFGYMAKTCRDHEFLSTGPVPPECIVAATPVGDA